MYENQEQLQQAINAASAPGTEATHQNEIDRTLQATHLDPTKDYGEPRFVFSRDGIGFFSKGDLQAIKAPQKNGKTFLISMLMGTLLKGEYNGLKTEIPEPRAVLIDTEQHPRNTVKVYRRASFIGGTDGWDFNPRLDCYHLRGKKKKVIRDCVFRALEVHRPDVMFIDGIVDMIEDFNSQQESDELISELMAAALLYDCAIVCVLHVNPGTDKMRGHLGTILAQKASDVLQCLKVKDDKSGQVSFHIEQTDARNQDIREFAFVIEDRQVNVGPRAGQEYIAVPIAPYISVNERSASNESMMKALEDGPLRYGDLVNKVMQLESVKRTAATDRVRSAIEASIIEQDKVTRKYRYVGLNVANEPNMPF